MVPFRVKWTLKQGIFFFLWLTNRISVGSNQDILPSFALSINMVTSCSKKTKDGDSFNAKNKTVAHKLMCVVGGQSRGVWKVLIDGSLFMWTYCVELNPQKTENVSQIHAHILGTLLLLCITINSQLGCSLPQTFLLPPGASVSPAPHPWLIFTRHSPTWQQRSFGAFEDAETVRVHHLKSGETGTRTQEGHCGRLASAQRS